MCIIVRYFHIKEDRNESVRLNESDIWADVTEIAVIMQEITFLFLVRLHVAQYNYMFADFVDTYIFMGFFADLFLPYCLCLIYSVHALILTNNCFCQYKNWMLYISRYLWQYILHSCTFCCKKEQKLFIMECGDAKWMGMR